jgi:hypothetical protein
MFWTLFSFPVLFRTTSFWKYIFKWRDRISDPAVFNCLLELFSRCWRCGLENRRTYSVQKLGASLEQRFLIVRFKGHPLSCLMKSELRATTAWIEAISTFEVKKLFEFCLVFTVCLLNVQRRDIFFTPHPWTYFVCSLQLFPLIKFSIKLTSTVHC